MAKVTQYISVARIRAVWADTRTPLRQAARELGCSFRYLQNRAYALGLPPRKTGCKEIHMPGFAELWASGLPASKIARVYDCCPATVFNTAERLSLPKRGRGRARRISVGDLLQERLRYQMARTAEVEQAEIAARAKADHSMMISYAAAMRSAAPAQEVRH